MSDHVKSREDLPNAYRYVVMRDTFMSGWGQAEGKDAIYVYPCDSHEQAEIVVKNARDRGDQDRILIYSAEAMPVAFPDDWHVMLASVESAARWYQPDSFTREMCDTCGGAGIIFTPVREIECHACEGSGWVEKASVR